MGIILLIYPQILWADAFVPMPWLYIKRYICMYMRQYRIIYCLAATRQQFPAVGIAPRMQRCVPTNLSTNKSGWKTNLIMQPTHLPPQTKARYVCMYLCSHMQHILFYQRQQPPSLLH